MVKIVFTTGTVCSVLGFIFIISTEHLSGEKRWILIKMFPANKNTCKTQEQVHLYNDINSFLIDNNNIIINVLIVAQHCKT